ncbi:hypothetical protein JCM10003_3231 [Bacteroides pyogenes JCM 10003]|nr:hypothetical protein JCM10003_3231 [Bacteroides pyogenes JCM 10003]
MFLQKKTEKKFRIIKVNVYLCRIEMDSVTYQVTVAFNRFFSKYQILSYTIQALIFRSPCIIYEIIPRFILFISSS